MKFQPLHDRVTIRRITEKSRTSSGILILDTAQEKPSQGEVVPVGSGRHDKKGNLVGMTVKPGDRVLFSKWSGTEIRIDGRNFLVMNEKDILGVLDQPSASRVAA